MTDYKLKNLVATDTIWDAAGDFAVGTGADTAVKKTTAEVSALLVSIVQASDISMATNDTLALTFAFVPSKIVINYSMRTVHDTSLEEAHSTGQCVITITGTDTFTSVLNMVHLGAFSGGAYGGNAELGDTTNVLWGKGGYESQYASDRATGAWVTATKTLTATWINADSGASGRLAMVATAYK